MMNISAYLYSHSLYLSLEHSIEGLKSMRSYRDKNICKDESDDLGWEIELIDDF